jgi:hypothetical protein
MDLKRSLLLIRLMFAFQLVALRGYTFLEKMSMLSFNIRLNDSERSIVDF